MSNNIPNKKDAQNAIETLVRYIEKIEGPLREGLLDTPKRVIDSYEELYQGYMVDVDALLEATFNAEGYDGIVLLRDIEFHSTCEHHMLPFTGSAHVAYIPVDKIVGISKLARLVELHAQRLQNQERITKSIADDLERVLSTQSEADVLPNWVVSLIAGIDWSEVAAARLENLEVLSANLSNRFIAPAPPLAPSEIPLGYPILSENRDELRRKLASRRIFCPVHWPLPAEVSSAQFPEAHSLSEKIMTLPLDQRYTIEDMARLAENVLELS